MKIGIYNDWWYPDLVGGTERSALEISQGLISHYGASQIVIATLSNSVRTKESIHGGTNQIRVGTFTLRSNYITTLSVRLLERIRLSLDIVSPLRVARAFRRHGVKIVVVHNMDRVGLKFIFILKRLYRIQIIRIVHDLSDTCIRRTRFKNNENCKQTCFSCRPKSMIYKRASSVYFNSVICNSKFTMDKLLSLHYVPKNINYGYVTFSPNNMEPIVIRDRISMGVAKIGYVGRISPEKGIETLMESLKIVKSNFQIDSELFIVGKGNQDYIANLRRFASNLEIVAHFVDYNSAPFEYLRSRVDLIVIPSKWEETLGRVAFEASENGFQVMVSDIGGLPEAAALSGKDFFTFTPGDVEDLARSIRSFVSDGKPNRKGMVAPKPILKEIITMIDGN